MRKVCFLSIVWMGNDSLQARNDAISKCSRVLTLTIGAGFPPQPKGWISNPKTDETGKGGYPFDEHRDKISDAQYELESLSKEVKAAVKPVLPNNGGEECI